MPQINNPTRKEIEEAIQKDKEFWDRLHVKFIVGNEYFTKMCEGTVVSEIPLDMLWIDMYGTIKPKKEWTHRKF